MKNIKNGKYWFNSEDYDIKPFKAKVGHHIVGFIIHINVLP